MFFTKRKEGPRTPEEWERWREEKLGRIAWFYRSSPQSKGTIIYGHGYRENHQCLEEEAEAAWNDGYNVITYDALGHDKSQNGKEGYFDSLMEHVDVSHALLLLAQKIAPGRPIFFGGHSMGAAVPLLLLIYRPHLQKYVQGVMPISTPLDVVGTARWNIPGGIYLLHLLSLTVGNWHVPQSFIGEQQRQAVWEPTLSSWCYRGQITFRVAYEFCGNGFILQKCIDRLRDVPICAFHGIHDTTARYDQARKYLGSLPNTEFHSLEADHYSLLRDWSLAQEIIEISRTWLRKRIATTA